MFTPYTKALAAIALALLLSQNAMAAKPTVDEETWQEMHQLRGQKAEVETKERLLKLKTALKLRDEQMASWGDYETHMLQAGEMRQNMRSAMRDRRMQREAPPNSLELAQQNVNRLEMQLAHARERLAVFSALYNDLDEEQRAIIDKLAHRKVKRNAKKLREMRGRGERGGRN